MYRVCVIILTVKKIILIGVIPLRKYSLLVADGDESFVHSLQTQLSKQNDFDLIGIAKDGNEALEMTRLLHPDALLTELLLPEIDGITLLRTIANMANPPVRIVCTRFYSDVVVEAARKYGAAYLLYKPISADYLLEIIKESTQIHQLIKDPESSDQEQSDVQRKIYELLSSFSLSPRHAGTGYLLEAMTLVLKDNALSHSLTKGLYPEIASRTFSTPQRIERCIRSAVMVAYEHGPLQSIFRKCPTNGEFIRYMLTRFRSS